MISSLKPLFKKLIHHGFRDRAVFYTFLSRFVSIGVAPFLVIAVGSYLNPEEQGVYYVFGSLLQLRGLIDLGFSQSSQQLLANRFADLTLDRSKGIQGREETMWQFLNMAKLTCVMYLIIGVLTLLTVGFAGDLFLSHHLITHPELVWRGAWWTMIVCVGIGISSMGIVVVADGANQVSMTNRWRFWSESSSLLIFIVVLACGGGLWASAAMAASKVWLAGPIAYSLGRPLIRHIATANSRAVNFRKTILPLQSRNMIVWGLGFLCYYAYNPMSLQFLGPVLAGIIGMSLQFSNMTSGLALVWYNTKLTKLGNLAGARNHEAANNLHLAGARISIGLWMLFALGSLSVIYLAKIHLPRFGARVSDIGPMMLFLLGTGAYVWCHVRASYVRAFCVELFAPLAFVQGLGTVLLLWWALPRWGIYGAASTYSLMMFTGAIWIELGYRSFLKRSWNASNPTGFGINDPSNLC